MANWISRNFVPGALALYAILALTGAAMLARFYDFHVWSIHRQLGLAMVPASLALFWRFRAGIRAESTRIALFLTLIAVALAGARLLRQRQPSPPPPDSTSAVIRALTATPLADLAPIYRSDPETMASRLRELGFTVSGPRRTPMQIAQASSRDEREVLGALTEFLRRPR
jgi:hypothetical protein